MVQVVVIGAASRCTKAIVTHQSSHSEIDLQRRKLQKKNPHISQSLTCLCDDKVEWMAHEEERHECSRVVERRFDRMHGDAAPGGGVVALVVQRVHVTVEELAQVREPCKLSCETVWNRFYMATTRTGGSPGVH